MDFRLHCNRTMCVVGPSHSGKTTFTLELLDRRKEIFDCQPNRVIWCYGIYQHELNSILTNKGYEAHAGIISVSKIQPFDIVVFDDLLNESSNSKDVTDMFTKTAHHKPCFIIFIVQNLFPPGKESRTRALNTQYYVIFKNPRDKSQIEVLARQILPRKSKGLIDLFESVTQKPHNVLLIHLTQECPEEFRYRSNIFGKPMYTYKLLN